MNHDRAISLGPTRSSARAFFRRGITGEVVMPNLLRPEA